MKIAVFSSCVSPSKGGIQNTGYLLCKGFENGNELSIYADVEDVRTFKKARIYECINGNGRLGRVAYYYKHFSRQNSRKRKSVALCLNWHNAIAPYLTRKKCRYYVMLHGNDILECTGSSILCALRKRLYSRIISNADGLFANSEYTKELAVKEGSKKTPVVINPCIEFDGTLRYKRKTGKHILRLLSIGRLERRKGFQTVVDAVSILKKNGIEVEYHIAGDGGYRDELNKKIQEQSLQDSIVLLGRIDEKQKEIEYESCDLFLMPSFVDEESFSVEGYGIVFIEANMYGIPVIGAKSGGVSEAIISGKTGWLVSPHDAGAIAKIVMNYINGKYEIEENDCILWAKQHDYVSICQKYLEKMGGVDTE